MNELDGTHLKTTDRQLAVELLAKCLESNEPVSAEIGHLNGVYSIEVSVPRYTCADEPR